MLDNDPNSSLSLNSSTFNNKVVEALMDGQLRNFLHSMIKEDEAILDNQIEYHSISKIINTIDQNTIEEGERCCNILRENGIDVFNLSLAIPNRILHIVKMSIPDNQVQKTLSLLESLSYYPSAIISDIKRINSLSLFRNDDSEFRILLVIVRSKFNKILNRVSNKLNLRSSMGVNSLGPHLTTSKGILREVLNSIVIKPNEVFVDIGCGSGAVLSSIYKKYKCKCIGYELDPNLVSIATNRIKNEGHSNYISIRQEDATQVSLDDADLLLSLIHI